MVQFTSIENNFIKIYTGYNLIFKKHDIQNAIKFKFIEYIQISLKKQNKTVKISATKKLQYYCTEVAVLEPQRHSEFLTKTQTKPKTNTKQEKTPNPQDQTG